MSALAALRHFLTPRPDRRVRRHLPADVILTGRKSRRGFSLTVTRGDRRASLFIRAGQPIDHKSAADGLMHWIGR